jgi:thioredoxin-related protein
MKKILTVVLFSMIFLSCESKVASEEKREISSYEKAIAKVKKSNKLVMLKLTSEDCHFCKKMDREVLEDKEIALFLDKNFILVEIDIKKERLPLALEYKVTPTFFFIDKNEKIIYKMQGSWNKKDFMDLLEIVLRKAKGDKK